MSDSEEPKPRKTRRAARACDECYRRKTRCDSDSIANGTCSMCSSSGIECTFLVQRKKRGPKPKNQNHADAKILINTVLSAPQTVMVPKDQTAVREMLVDISAYARDLEQRLDQALRALNQVRQSTSSASPPELTVSSGDSPSYDAELEEEETDDPQDTLSLRFQGLDINDIYSKRYLGKSSHLMFLQTALAIRDQVSGGPNTGTITVGVKRAEFWNKAPWHQFVPEATPPPFIFPPDDLLHDLLDAYFSYVHYIYPILHRKTFERLILRDKLHLTDRRLGAVLLAVCALGSRQLKDPRNLHEYPDGTRTQNERSSGWKYFTQINFGRQPSAGDETPSLYEVQLCALMLIFLFPTPLTDAGWVLCGLGIRLAQDVGAHRKTFVNKLDPSRSTIEVELWRRAFWSLTMTDVYMSMATGRPRSAREDDFDLELPPDCDDEYWEHSNPDLAFVQPPGRPSHMSYLYYHTKLMRITGLVKDTLFTTRKAAPWSDTSPQFNTKVVIELDSLLNSWLNSLPEHLKWDPDRTDEILFTQTAMLHLTFNWVQMQVHKLFIRPTSEFASAKDEASFPSLAICTTAARTYIHMLQTYHRRPSAIMWPTFIVPLFMSAIILLINIWTSTRSGSPTRNRLDIRKEMTGVQSCLQFLVSYEQSYELAGRLRDILQAVISVSQMPSNHPDASSLKRTREAQEAEEGAASITRPSRIIDSLRHSSNSNTWPQNPFFDVDAFDAAQPVPGGSPVNSSMFDSSVYGTAVEGNATNTASFSQSIHPDVGGATGSMLSDTSFNPYMFGGAMGVLPDGVNVGVDGLDFSFAVPGGFPGSDPSHEDWQSFMSRVDELLHFVNPEGL